MGNETYKLEELAEKAGVSPRTVRYYVQRGLLPAPAFRGKDTAYDAGHLVRLQAIRRLQQSYLPLDAIQQQLEGRSLEELQALADGTALVPSVPAPIVPAAPQIPAAPPRVAREAAAPATHWSRVTLRPGLELHLADDADDDTRRLFRHLLDEATHAETTHAESTHAQHPAASPATGRRPPGRTGGTP